MKKLLFSLIALFVLVGCTSSNEVKKDVLTCTTTSGLEEMGFKSTAEEVHQFEDDVLISTETKVIMSDWTEDAILSQEDYRGLLESEDTEVSFDGITTSYEFEDDKIIVNSKVVYAELDESMRNEVPTSKEEVIKITEEMGGTCK